MLRRRADTVDDLRRMFAYIFEPPRQRGGGVPQLSLFRIAGPFSLGGVEIVPVPLLHGVLPDPRLPHRLVRVPDRLQSRFRTSRGRCSTACARSSRRAARPAALDALQRRRSARRRPRGSAPTRTYFTHICHDLPHAATCARLPAGVELAYDGSVLARLRDEPLQRRWTSSIFPTIRGPRAGCSRCSRSATSTACTAATARSSSACGASPASAAPRRSS